MNSIDKKKKPALIERLAHRVFDWASKVDTRKVLKNIKTLREEFPEATNDELIETLIKRKCQRTAKIGVATSAASIVPILGTALSLTIGMVADLGGTITSQAELVLEIAEILEIPMTESEKRETVFIVLGIGASAQHLSVRAGKSVLNKLGQRYAKRWVGKAIPFLGIVASGSINYLSTYLIGKRALAYFVKGPETMGSWQHSLNALTGLDADKLSEWMGESKEQVGFKLTALGQEITKQTQGGIETGQTWVNKVLGKEQVVDSSTTSADVEDIKIVDVTAEEVNEEAETHT